MKIERFVSAEDDISPLYTLSRTEETTCVQQVLSLFFNQFSASLYIKGVKWTYLGPNLNVLKHYFICNFKMKTTESLKTDSDLLVTCFLHKAQPSLCFKYGASAFMTWKPKYKGKISIHIKFSTAKLVQVWALLFSDVF